jgi:shikimate dehydrogenase
VAALKLAAENVAELFLVNRTSSKAATVAAEIRRRHPNVKVQLGYPRGCVDLAMNATSLGLAPTDPLPVDEKQFSLRQALAVYDMVYRPAETAFLRVAKAGGSRTANGLGMLLYQGAKALEIWSGKPAPIEAMRRALEENVYGS